jgi:hypothetical protein
MTGEEKLILLLGFSYLGLILVSFMVIMRTIGNIEHSVNRLQDIISKELVLTFNRTVTQLKSEHQRRLAAIERARRQEAMLNVPMFDDNVPPPP